MFKKVENKEPIFANTSSADFFVLIYSTICSYCLLKWIIERILYSPSKYSPISTSMVLSAVFFSIDNISTQLYSFFLFNQFSKNPRRPFSSLYLIISKFISKIVDLLIE